MIAQIGFQELLKYVFKNNNKRYLVINNILDINFHIKQKGYSLIRLYFIENQYKINNFNLLLGILSTLAYGHPSDKFKYCIRKMIVRNKKLIIKDIDKLNKVLNGSFNLEEYLSLKEIFNKKISFELLQTIESTWVEYRLHKQYFYGINYLLIYFSKYSYVSFEKWFLKTNSARLKAIFTSQILSCYNYYQNEQTYLNSKIDFLRVASTISIYLDGNKIFDLKPNKESLYFIILYIKRNYYILDDNNIENFYVDIEKFKVHFQYLTIELLNEFSEINSNILYEIVKLVEDKIIKNKMIHNILELLDSQLKSKNKQHIFKNKIEDANLYGKIILELDDITQIQKIENKFDKLYHEISEPYYFYRFHAKYLNYMEQILYYLIIIYTYYFGKDAKIINEYKQKFIEILKEFNLIDIDSINSMIKQAKRKINVRK